MNEEPPTEHQISFKNAQSFLRADFPDTFGVEDRLPKVSFLTQFWQEFYLIAKYGVDEFNIAPSDLFGDSRKGISFHPFHSLGVHEDPMAARLPCSE